MLVELAMESLGYDLSYAYYYYQMPTPPAECCEFVYAKGEVITNEDLFRCSLNNCFCFSLPDAKLYRPISNQMH